MRIENRGATSYDLLADEYYNVERHPTCSNFRSASKALLARYVNILRGNPVLEVGAGNSIVAELLLAGNWKIENLIISDISSRMLRHSCHYEVLGANLAIIDAENMNVKANSIPCMVASLGDPYNTKRFWSEVSRVLIGDGVCIFTSPAHGWATRFRTQSEMSLAHFSLGQFSIEVQSQILPIEAQIELIEGNGLRIRDVHSIRFRELNDSIISDKIRLGDPELHIVTSYCVVKSYQSWRGFH